MSGLRNAIARDLHDSVAQSLAGAGYWLQSLQMKQGMPDHIRQDIARTKDALDKENSGIRAIIDRLRDDIEMGGRVHLGEELRGIIKDLASQWRLEITLNTPPDPLVVTPATAHNIQQILREALANAVRHGKAGKVVVTVARQAGRVALTIDDDGSGFAVAALCEAPRSLSERSLALGGSIEAANGACGARVVIDLPGELFK